MKYQSNGEIECKKISKERKNSRIRTESTSSANSMELNPARVRKGKNTSLFESENSQDEMVESNSPVNDAKIDSSDEEKSPEKKMTKVLSNDSVLTPVIKNPEALCNGKSSLEKDKRTSKLSPIDKLSTKSIIIKHRKRLKSFDQSDDDDETENVKKDNDISLLKKPGKSKKPKIDKQEQIKDKAIVKEKKKMVNYGTKKDAGKKKRDKIVIFNNKKKKIPQAPQLHILENNKVSSWDVHNQKL